MDLGLGDGEGGGADALKLGEPLKRIIVRLNCYRECCETMTQQRYWGLTHAVANRLMFLSDAVKTARNVQQASRCVQQIAEPFLT